MELKEVFPIGIGTYNLDLTNREETKNALLASIMLGQNLIDVSFLYGEGEVMKLVAEVLENIDRDIVFVVCKISNYINSKKDIEMYLDEYLKILKLDYVDCLELHAPWISNITLEDFFNEMMRLKSLGKIRYIGISNFSIAQLNHINAYFEVDVCDGLYNLENKICEDEGMIKYARGNDMVFTCYQPLRRNRTANRNYPLLVELSQKYKKTQNQIILNWIVKEKKIIPVVKSNNIENIKENVDSLNFTIEPEDIVRLNEFRAHDFSNVMVNWNWDELEGSSNGVRIDQLPNQFE